MISNSTKQVDSVTNRVSKTHIENRARAKTNSYLVNAIMTLKKTNVEVAKLLAMPKKKWPAVNLEYISRQAKDGEKLFVPGKILSSGSLDKKVTLISWSASDKAKEKMKESKSEFIELTQELKNNPSLKGVKILA